jgi:hypothetical protein
MRLKFLFASLLLALLVLVACSSMELSREEAYQLPADFNWLEFAELNPDISLSKAIVPFAQWNEKWIDSMKTEKGNLPNVINNYLAPYIEEFIDTDGMGIKIAKERLFWPEDKIEKIHDVPFATTNAIILTGYYSYYNTVDDTLKAHEYFEWLALRKFILYGMQGEEMRLLDSISEIKPSDSTLFYKNYALLGKKNGRAYRVCKPDEKKVLRSEIDKNDYINNLFCAYTEDGQPYKVYAIPGANN